MAARAIASASVSFGLVSIPVKVYTATQSSANISFNMLHKKCGSRLKQQYICPVDDEIVTRDDMVKGYEFAKDRYVQFSKEDIEAFEEKSTQTIEITEFLPASKVDAIYYDKAYYLGPDKGGDRAYRLIAKVMAETERVALAKYAARGKQYLVMLRPLQGGLVMQQLHYADEVRPMSEVPLGEHGPVKESELKLAKQLVDQTASQVFRPESYEDDVRKRVLEAIERKVEGEDVTLAPTEAPQAQIIDLMDALKASVGARKPAGDEGRKPAKRAESGRKSSDDTDESEEEEQPRARKSRSK